MMETPPEPFRELFAHYPSLESQRGAIEGAFELLVGTFAAEGKLLICGNGGSAADSDHLAGELLKGFDLPRPLLPDEREGLTPLTAQRLQRALPVIPLTAFSAFQSAFLNDVDSAFAFAQLTFALGRPGDALLAISTSGNSRNVLLAAEVAKARGMRVIGLSGATGGLLTPYCDQAILVPEIRTHRIQEFHLPIYHALCLALEQKFFGGEDAAAE